MDGVLITEAMVERYHELNKQAKELEKELSKLKKSFNLYFDLTVGQNEKGELAFENYVLQRQIRTSEKFREEAVQKLEEMRLTDCIKVEKKVDEEKVNAAITLGIIPADSLSDLKDRKHSSAIYVREL
ncbi:hypothetical protein OEV98_13035 [Caldibacillus lycopersici]|uniref:Uncharacterized protein n=1 Tax=Perspicuibacillus lycopersici TaxID=1325689 RepID=A0AAE3IVP0_9BACI|nr:hypothetical protein [Perspicuibacillus lycopersici]MCU9614463.1 hypothetical protein [Perspicuibacillus lycopersici]